MSHLLVIRVGYQSNNTQCSLNSLWAPRHTCGNTKWNQGPDSKILNTLWLSLSLFSSFFWSSQNYLSKAKNKQSLWISSLEWVCNIFHSACFNILHQKCHSSFISGLQPSCILKACSDFHLSISIFSQTFIYILWILRINFGPVVLYFIFVLLFSISKRKRYCLITKAGVNIVVFNIPSVPTM